VLDMLLTLAYAHQRDSYRGNAGSKIELRLCSVQTGAGTNHKASNNLPWYDV